jgi:hypothetical protein
VFVPRKFFKFGEQKLTHMEGLTALFTTQTSLKKFSKDKQSSFF